MLQGTRNSTKMAYAKYECQRREPKQFQAQQVAIVQKFVGGGNNGLIAIEEENDNGSTMPTRPSPLNTEPVLVSPSNEVNYSMKTQQMSCYSMKYGSTDACGTLVLGPIKRRQRKLKHGNKYQ